MIHDFNAVFKAVYSKYSKYLEPNSAAFCSRVYNEGIMKYTIRLKAIRFDQFGSVLDAGCGFGQWTLALAKLNQRVSAVDSSPTRLFYLDAMIQALEIKKIDLQWADISDLPFPSDSFEGVVCYGVIFCTDWLKSLAEFYRVLKPGGRLYVTANGLGWQVYLWKNSPNKTTDYDPRSNVALSFQNTLDYNCLHKPPKQGQIIIEQEEFSHRLSQLGFQIIAQGDEGSICLDPNGEPPESFFDGTYHGETGVYEFLAEKGELK